MSEPDDPARALPGVAGDGGLLVPVDTSRTRAPGSSPKLCREVLL